MPTDEPRDQVSGVTLSNEVTARLMANVDVIARRMARRIADWPVPLPPEYRRIAYLRLVLQACRDALLTLLRLLHDGRGLRPGDLDRLGEMGAQQAELGVPLEVLLAGYRLAAKVVWEEVSNALVGEETDLSATAIFAIADSVIGYLDDISGAVGAAYLGTRERLLRERDRDRDRVLHRLLAGDTSAELHQLAAAIELDLKPPYRVVACVADGGHGKNPNLEQLSLPAGCHVVTDAITAGWMALLPPTVDVAALWRRWERTLVTRAESHSPGLFFGVGPVATELTRVEAAANRARQALITGRQLNPLIPIHDDADVGIFVALASDREALTSFVHHVLGRLAVSVAPRDLELRETLEVLLAHNSVSDTAAALSLHRHTVVYRVRRLEELGIDATSPTQRPRLWLALQGLRLLQGEPTNVAADSTGQS